MDGGSFISPVIALLRWIAELVKRPSPEKILRHRKTIKTELIRNLEEQFKDYFGEVIIVDANQLTSYPKNIFKTEVKGLYHNGLEVYENRDYVLADEKRHTCRTTEKSNPKAVLAQFVSRIPYANIVDVEQSGTEYATEPHIYCKFKRGTPYENTVCYEPVVNENDELSYYKPLGEFRPSWKVRIRGLLNWVKR